MQCHCLGREVPGSPSAHVLTQVRARGQNWTKEVKGRRVWSKHLGPSKIMSNSQLSPRLSRSTDFGDEMPRGQSQRNGRRAIWRHIPGTGQDTPMQINW